MAVICLCMSSLHNVCVVYCLIKCWHLNNIGDIILLETKCIEFIWIMTSLNASNNDLDNVFSIFFMKELPIETVCFRLQLHLFYFILFFYKQ